MQIDRTSYAEIKYMYVRKASSQISILKYFSSSTIEFLAKIKAKIRKSSKTSKSGSYNFAMLKYCSNLQYSKKGPARLLMVKNKKEIEKKNLDFECFQVVKTGFNEKTKFE